jgi:long-chain fatty acid transport protein
MISFSLGGKLVQGKRTQDLKATAFGTLYANQKYEFNATGYNGVVGLNCKPMPELTIGLTYQTATKLDFKYEKETYDVSTLLQSLLPRVEGLKMRRDLPQIISAGVEYAAMPELSISLSGVMYLMNKADLGKIGGPTAPTSKDVNKYFGPGYEVGLGVVYKVMPELKVGGTFMYTTQAGKDELYTDSAAHLFVSGNPVLDSLMFGAGVQYTVMPNLDITFAGNWVHYLPKEYTISANNAKGKYEKEVYTIALGVGYKI